MRPHAVQLARFLALLLSLAAVPAAWGWAFPMPATIGPAIRFSRVPSAGTSAYYSILVGVQGSQAAVSPCVKLVVKSGKVATSQQVLDAYGGYTFVRWKLQVALGSKQQAVSYQVVSTCTNIRLSSNATAAYTFYVPSKTQSWHWGYYSCNGHPSLADAPPTGIDPLWNDLLKQHASRPMHLVAGNGDQLYNDGVLASDPAIQAAATADETDLTLNFKWTDASRAAASDWFFSHYAFHWSLYSTPYRKALASIPFTMMLDDHEMLNGYGSQPTSIFNTDLVQGLGALGRRFYLLFQQHSTPALMMEDLAWNKAGPALHIVSRLGPSTAILVPDVRFERTANQVMSLASYTRIQQQLNALPTSVKQLVVLTPQPMAFPVITELEQTVLKAVSVFGLNNWSEVQDYLESPVGRGGLLPILKQNFRLQFGTPDISDVLDQWSCVNHREERAKFVNMLQAWSLQRKARVTYLAGDAHLAFANQFQSAGSVPVAKDYRYSLSLISSAIGNNGNKAGALLLEATGGDFQDTLDATGKTVITELAPFNDIKGLPLGSEYGAAARNWLDISESSAGELVMTLRFESYGFRLFPPGQVFQPVTKTFKVPRLTI